MLPMPILDVEPVVADGQELPAGLAASLADAAGKVFGAGPGTTWVRVRPLPQSQYAENDAGEPEGFGSVFVRVLKASLPEGPDLDTEVTSLAQAVATVCARNPENVHILYEPPAAGRIAFGGKVRR